MVCPWSPWPVDVAARAVAGVGCKGVGSDGFLSSADRRPDVLRRGGRYQINEQAA